MRIIHIEMPRHFTLSIKEYLSEADVALTDTGHQFRQFDINPNFWSWLLSLSTPHNPGDSFGPLVDAACGAGNLMERLADVQTHLSNIATYYGTSFSLSGLNLPRSVVDSAYALCALASDNFGCGLFANFFHTIEPLTNLLGADVLSLGIDSQAGVFWAIQLAAWARSAGYKGHITIGRHSYENFSLVHHVEALTRNPWFFGLIDSVIVHEELIANTLVRLAGYCDGRSSNLENLAIRCPDDQVRVVPPAAMRAANMCNDRRIPESYFQDTGVPCELLVYSMWMVRNKCFYSACTFCAQITKHLSGYARRVPEELDRAVSIVRQLHHNGVGMINFQDEAMRPTDAVEFSRSLTAIGAPPAWVGRMIAAANTKRDHLKQMRDGGCREILFGLETFDADTARAMGKVSARTTADPGAVIESVLDADLFLILSMIHSFPTETSRARAENLCRIESVQTTSTKVGVIFNRFQLFHTSEIYRNPERFNIASVESPSPENDLQYNFQYDLRSPRAGVTDSQLGKMEQLELGMDAKSYRLARNRYGDLLRMAYHIDYSSLGLWHRVNDGCTLLQRTFTPAK